MKNLSGKYLKCGNLYVKFGDDGLPDYSFKVHDTYIEEFINMRNDKEPEEIIMPPIVTEKLDKFIDDDELAYIKENLSPNSERKYFIPILYYLRGYVYISDNCFQDLKDKKIIIKTDYPIKFETSSFNNCENITFVLPQNQTLYNVYECCNSVFDYEHSHFNLIGHKNFPFNHFDAGSSKYTISEYDKNKSEFKIEHYDLTKSEPSK